MTDWMSSQGNLLLKDLIISLIFIASVMMLRTLLVRSISHAGDLPLDNRRRWIVHIRNILVLVTLVGLVFIWAHELQTLALSLVAVAAALAIATKELILCFSGGIWRTISKAYAVGDRIEVGAARGEVVDVSLFATTVLQVEAGSHAQQYTGRSVTFPNSLLLTTPLVTEGYTGDYVVRAIVVPLASSDDWQRAEKLLLQIANDECAKYIEQAQQHMDRIRRDQGLDTPSVEPRVTIELPEPGRVNLLLRFTAPRGREGKIAQVILHRFFAEFHRNVHPGGA